MFDLEACLRGEKSAWDAFVDRFGRVIYAAVSRTIRLRRSSCDDGTIQDVAPALMPNIEIGMPGFGGPIITAGGLIFIGSVMDNYLRAFDIENGAILWEGRLPAGGQATPMTFLDDKTGKQIVVIAAGGHPNMGTTLGDYVVAFALPDNN